MNRRFAMLLIGLVALNVIGCRSTITHKHLNSIGDTNAVVSASIESTYYRIISQKSGAEIVPGVDIYADGCCHVRRFDGTEQEKQIAQSKLSELLGFLDQTGFFDLSERQIEAEIKASQRRQLEANVEATQKWHFVFHQNDTSIVARTSAKSNRVSRYALNYELEWYPEIVELQVMRNALTKVYETVGEPKPL